MTNQPAQAALVRAAASFVRDTYSGEWADDAATTLETDADLIERGEPCSLLRLAETMQPAAVSAAVAPPTDTTHGLSVPHADALWDAVAIPGPRTPTYPEQHERVCRVVREILDELTPARDEDADQAELRDRIAEALMQWAEGNNSPKYTSMRRPETVVQNAYSRADAVLAVLPSSGCLTPEYTDGPCHCPACDPAAHRTDRAAVLADVERAIRAATGSCGYKAEDGCDFCGGVDAALDQVRRMADEGVTPPPALTEKGRLRAQVQVLQQDAERDQGLAKVGARCMREGHQGLIESGRATVEGHRFALSVALGLGTGATWDAIHERVNELRRMADETATQTPARLLDCGLCYEEHGEEIHPHPECTVDRLTELEAEHQRWAAVHDLIERAIDKGNSSIDLWLIEDALGPTPAAGARQDGTET
jgi:hypothetical protein